MGPERRHSAYCTLPAEELMATGSQDRPTQQCRSLRPKIGLLTRVRHQLIPLGADRGHSKHHPSGAHPVRTPGPSLAGRRSYRNRLVAATGADRRWISGR